MHSVQLNLVVPLHSLQEAWHSKGILKKIKDKWVTINKIKILFNDKETKKEKLIMLADLKIINFQNKIYFVFLKSNIILIQNKTYSLTANWYH